MADIYLGLVHYPVYNKFKQEVTTSITNLDIHDISRTCKTYDVKKFYIINPLKTQEEFLNRILKFWNSKPAQRFNPHRVKALKLITYVKDIETAQKEIKNQEKVCPLIVTTSAIRHRAPMLFKNFPNQEKPVLLLFGTGNGLTRETHNMADYVLEPIPGRDGYNHLSVRSAIAIVLDRLFSEK